MHDEKRISRETMDDAGKAGLAQRHQQQALGNLTDQINQGLGVLSQINDSNLSELESLLEQSEVLLQKQGVNTDVIDYTNVNTSAIDKMLNLSEKEVQSIKAYTFDHVDTIDFGESVSWEDYLANIEGYAEKHHIDLSVDPFQELMTAKDRAEIAKRIKDDYTMKKAHCDKWDYIIAASSGVVCGLIDAFFVGMPGKSKLGNWTDKMADNLVEKFTGFVFNADKKAKSALQNKAPEGIASCIGYLEHRFKVNYDARYAADLGLTTEQLSMAPVNHHLKSLGHAPDIIGLFFSLLDQFTNTTSIISDGQIIRIENKDGNFRLQGDNFIAKLFCGFFNWLGHIMSDLAGSSGTRGHKNTRGSGIPMPFFELFQLCDFGSFNVGGDQKTLAEFSTKMFQEGYDARHGAAMAIPVFLNEIIIRVSFTIKRKFYHKKTWKESMPFGNQPELRRMLVVGHGSLCIVDAIDAGIRSGGNVLTFALHLNLVAWQKFAFSGLREIMAIYRGNMLDMDTLNRDLDAEWERLNA
ncbi:MAG: hypothetical protein LBD24_09490 [Spirochaetaceae bacterium]|jgi:hypothetical protein|nr:hypothetical protein [Spirochaetaceae bacterium]